MKRNSISQPYIDPYNGATYWGGEVNWGDDPEWVDPAITARKLLEERKTRKRAAEEQANQIKAARMVNRYIIPPPGARPPHYSYWQMIHRGDPIRGTRILEDA
jgi:hypothetical protein